MPDTETRFAVLLFTDIVGSTELKARHGVPAYSEALRAHNGHFERIARDCLNVRTLQTRGDGYFAEAGSIAEAVRFALLFEEAMREGPWGTVRLSVRVGIHAGEVGTLVAAAPSPQEVPSPRDTWIVGPAADLAARITDLAMGGQILLTRFPFDEARHFIREHPPVAGKAMPPLCWLAHGPYLLKGRDEPMDIFEVGAEGLAPLVAPPDGDKAKRAIRPGEEETLGWRPAIGLEIPGRPDWHLIERLGAGGFGEVWTGEHAKLHQRRAFKFCFDDERLRALKREVTLVRLLRSALGERDDIVHIHELKLDTPPFYLESDLAPHGNLLQWAECQGGLDKIPLAQRIALVAHAATALAAAHSVGVLHKDIKPTNILIFDGPNGEPRPRLVDFGIGTLADPAVLKEFGVTGAGFTRATLERSTGTPTYSPPEYLAGKPYTIQGDIYGLGVLLYQLVTLKPHDPLAQGWEREVTDPFLREDIAACVDGDPTRRLPSAADLSTCLHSLDTRRNEEQARIADESHRLRFAIFGVISMLIFILGGVAFALHTAIPLPSGENAHFIVINTFSLLDLLSAFITGHLFLSVFYRCLRTTRRNTDMIFSFLLLQLLAWCMFTLTVDNIVPEGVAANAIPAAAEATLFLYRLMYIVGLAMLPTMTHFALRYTGSQRFADWKALYLYAGAVALSPICWFDSFLRIRTMPLKETSSLLCAVPFQPYSDVLVFPFSAVWLAVNIYVQWLLWPHRRIQEAEDSRKTRSNLVWVGITFYGLAGVIEMFLAAVGYAAVDPNTVFETVTMAALAVGLAREAARPEGKRAETGRRLQTQTEAVRLK